MGLILGINSYGMVFEGESEHGAHLVLPQPVMTLAKFAKTTDEALVPATDNEIGHCYFREDFFDPVSRIRRGRFYQATGNVNNWQVLQTSSISISGTHNLNGLIGVSLRGYKVYKLSSSSDGSQDFVVLGSSSAFGTWSIVAIEMISTGEELVTLKARQSLGALPDVYWGKLPAEHRHKVQEALEKLADDYRRAVPESVIDRAREAATAILSAYLQSKGIDTASGKDIGDLVKKFAGNAGPHEQRIVACAAEITQRLHSRGKHAEKEKYDDLRSIREQDAELAVQCVGVMLCDLRWADWK
jgi:HEPN domain-containing protein